MALYTNKNASSPILSVEFSPVPEGNLSFFRAPLTAGDEIRNLLTSSTIGQQIVAETVANGERVFVTRGQKPQAELMQALQGHGNNFQIPSPQKNFQPWKWRGNVTMVGHILQYLSSVMKTGHTDTATKVFASSNILANLTNITFGAEEAPDTNRLRFFKEQFNETFRSELPEGSILPVTDSRAALRKDTQAPKPLSQKAYDFMRHNSVRIGEIGLRFFGAFALAFPVKNWSAASQALRQGAFKEAFKIGKNSESQANFVAGSAYFIGKVVALFSKAPDPYADPSKDTAFEKFRTQYSFKLGGLIEGIAPFILIKDRFTNPKARITLPNSKFLPESVAGKPVRGAETPDFVGGVGGIFFAIGQTIRFFAPFGVRKTDMNEAYAYITDTLAKAPPENLPALVAKSAAAVQTHFKEQPLEFGKIYTQLADDLYRYHGIALPVPSLADSLTTALETEAAPTRKFTDAIHPTYKLPIVTPPASYADKTSIPAGFTAASR